MILFCRLSVNCIGDRGGRGVKKLKKKVTWLNISVFLFASGLFCGFWKFKFDDLMVAILHFYYGALQPSYSNEYALWELHYVSKGRRCECQKIQIGEYTTGAGRRNNGRHYKHRKNYYCTAIGLVMLVRCITSSNDTAASFHAAFARRCGQSLQVKQI